MTDLGAKLTDDEINGIEEELKSLYKEAYDDILKKQEDFNTRYAKKEAIHLKDVQSGKWTQEEFDTWKAGQVFQGKQWENKKKQILDTMYKTNSVATDIINGKTRGVFAFNANYTAYKLEHGAGINFGFGLYDETTVINLLKNDPQLLPKWKIDQPKDYTWNQKKLNKHLNLGIIEGESLDKISKRFTDALCTQNFNKMRTFARTALTGAQNSGRQISLEEAKALGINVKKEWMATLDAHTRMTHRKLDGQKVNLDKSFEINGMSIRFPGDPLAPAALVYNCRCTMVGDLSDYPSEYKRYDNLNGKRISNMTYEEWEAENKKAAQAAEDTVWMLDESEAASVISLFTGKKMSNLYNEMREFDTKTANAFYKELKSLGKPSEIWQQYLDGTLPDDIDTSRLNGILQSYAEKKGLVVPEIKSIGDQLKGKNLTFIQSKLNGREYNELYQAMMSIRAEGEFAPEVWEKYLSGKLSPKDAAKLDSILGKYANKLGIDVPVTPVTPVTPSGSTLKEIFTGKKMSNVFNEMKAFDKSIANQFYKELGKMGKPSDIWQQYLDGKLPIDQKEKIESILNDYANKAGLIKPVTPTIDIKTLVGDKKMSNVFNELKAIDTKTANAFYKELKSLGKPSEVWDKYLKGEIKSPTLDEIIKTNFGNKIPSEIKPKADKSKDDKSKINKPKSIKDLTKEHLGKASWTDVMDKMDQIDKTYELSDSLWETMLLINGKDPKGAWEKYLKGELSKYDNERIEAILQQYFNKAGLLKKAKDEKRPDEEWVEKNLKAKIFDKCAKSGKNAREKTITAVMKTPENYRKCFINTMKNTKFFNEKDKAFYRDYEKAISINFDKILRRDKSLGTLFHETGHAMDYAYMYARNKDKAWYEILPQDRTSQLPSFLSAIEKDLQYISKYIYSPKLDYDRDMWDDASKGVQDFFSALNPLNDQGPRQGKIPKNLLKVRYNWCHDYDYYTRNNDPMIEAASELFANISGGYGDSNQMKYMEKYFPNAVKEFDNIIDEMAKMIDL